MLWNLPPLWMLQPVLEVFLVHAVVMLVDAWSTFVKLESCKAMGEEKFAVREDAHCS